MTTIHKLSKEGKKILNTRKHKCIVRVAPSVEIDPSYWSGGSRTITLLLNLKTNKLEHIEDYGYNAVSTPFEDHKNRDIVTLIGNHAVVKVGTFCGKEATPIIVINDESLIKHLIKE